MITLPLHCGDMMQISKYVEREIINHKQLRHPHIVELKEVCACPSALARHARITVLLSPCHLSHLSAAEAGIMLVQALLIPALLCYPQSAPKSS